MLLPQGIFAQAVATVAFPTFSAQVAAGDRAQLMATLSGLLRLILFLSIPAAFLLYVLDEPLIELLFQRGRFDAASTQAVAYALRFFALGLVAHAVVEIVVRVFYALHDTATPVVAGVATVALNILLSLALIGRLSFGGLALANSIATALEMLVLLVLLARKVRAPNQAAGQATNRAGPARAPAADQRGARASGVRGHGRRNSPRPGTSARRRRPSSGFLPAGSRPSFGAGLGVLIYVVASYLLGSAEIRQLAALARRRAQT